MSTQVIPTKGFGSAPGRPFSPFQVPAPAHLNVPYLEVCGVDDRVRLVREMNVEQLERVVAIGWAIQRTVLLAAERRLRKLRKARKNT